MTAGRLYDSRGVPLITAMVDWSCPNCWITATTAAHMPNRFHQCPGLMGLVAPLIRVGDDCKVTAVERGDYEGREVTQHGDDKRSYCAVRTDRSDGSNDLAVLAPCATARIG